MHSGFGRKGASFLLHTEGEGGSLGVDIVLSSAWRAAT